MLLNLNANKAAGPDELHGKLLKNTAKESAPLLQAIFQCSIESGEIPEASLNMLAPELAPIVHAIFTQSLDTGELPRDWSLANVAPIFKKGNRVLAENYRPVSLTCITCKLFEHIEYVGGSKYDSLLHARSRIRSK